MANTYTQIYIHAVFSPLRREAMIMRPWADRLHRYITGIVQTKGHKLLAINSMPDHLHLFMGIRPDETVSDISRDVKRDSSYFVNHERLVRGHFAWQDGFGAISHSHSEIPGIAAYIMEQERHHRKRSFREEYEEMLRQFAVDHDARYLFKWIDVGPLNP